MTARRTAALVWLLAGTPAAAAGQADVLPVEVLAPERDFGYRVGDLLELGAVIRVPAGFRLDARSLEDARLPAWLEVSERSAEADGAGEDRRYRVRFVYQLFRVPEGVERLEIPSRQLSFRSDGGERETRAYLPPFAFTASPLTDTMSVASGDWRPAPSSASALRIRGAALVVLLATWGGVTAAERRRRLAGPLSRARDRVGRAADCREAAAELHRALEQRAGGALFGHDLDRLIARWPPAREARAELEEFFALSRALFFAPDGDGAGDVGAEECRARLVRLSARLAEFERRGPYAR